MDMALQKLADLTGDSTLHLAVGDISTQNLDWWGWTVYLWSLPANIFITWPTYYLNLLWTWPIYTIVYFVQAGALALFG